MTQELFQPIYDLSLNVLVGWQAHSLSNAGSNGTNRVFPRQQLLADGTLTDACSGNILKHHHSTLLAEYLEACGASLCPACRARDPRRAAALIDQPAYQHLSLRQVLCECALCDAHGFLVTAKNASEEDQEGQARERLHKHTLIDFSYALALPGSSQETVQLATRNGASKEEGQMLMKMSSRSGAYALCLRYHAVGIGADTERWKLFVTNEQERRVRHQAILRALRDGLLSPDGALTATMLPHLTSLSGALVICPSAGRAPISSALDPAFITRLQALASESCQVEVFDSTAAFAAQMDRLIATSVPARARAWEQETAEKREGETV
jgi:CRISPR/Cas system-associated protein Cas7 (RAMP superfamily)